VLQPLSFQPNMFKNILFKHVCFSLKHFEGCLFWQDFTTSRKISLKKTSFRSFCFSGKQLQKPTTDSFNWASVTDFLCVYLCIFFHLIWFCGEGKICLPDICIFFTPQTICWPIFLIIFLSFLRLRHSTGSTSTSLDFFPIELSWPYVNLWRDNPTARALTCTQNL